MKAIILFIAVVLMICSNNGLLAQYDGSKGDGYGASFYQGGLNGQENVLMFGGGSDGYTRQGRTGSLHLEDKNTPYRSGSGDGYASAFFIGTLGGKDLAYIFSGGPSDGHASSGRSAFIRDANAIIILNCTPDYMLANESVLDGIVQQNIVYQAARIIESIQQLTTGFDVHYDAGEEVQLLEGFEVPLGALFEVLLDGCQIGQ